MVSGVARVCRLGEGISRRASRMADASVEVDGAGSANDLGSDVGGRVVD
jgi:hypothetical protein